MPFTLCLPVQAERMEPIVQIGSYANLVAGRYDGRVPIRHVLNPHSLGLGTYNGLDGEGVIVDGIAYQVNGLGDARVVAADAKTPFAFAVNFRPSVTLRVRGPISLARLNWMITKRMGADGFLAIRVEGEFSAVTGRSFAGQLKPYKPFEKIRDQQSVYAFPKLSATLVGFRMPPTVADHNVNVPGYHFHFLSRDRKTGGHLLRARVQDVTVRVMRVTRIAALP